MVPLTMADTHDGYFITSFQISYGADPSLAVGSELCVLCFLYEKEKLNFLLYHFSYLFYFLLFLCYIKNQGILHKMQMK